LKTRETIGYTASVVSPSGGSPGSQPRLLGLSIRRLNVGSRQALHVPNSQWQTGPLLTQTESEGCRQPTYLANGDTHGCSSGVGRKVQLGPGTDRAPSDPRWILSIEGRGHGRTMASPESLQVAAQLDEHHFPETNGRIAVCRRCGARTDGPNGLHHVLQEGAVSRSSDWLTAQSRLLDIANAKLLRGR
jgi:hypothetical protein